MIDRSFVEKIESLVRSDNSIRRMDGRDDAVWMRDENGSWAEYKPSVPPVSWSTTSLDDFVKLVNASFGETDKAVFVGKKITAVILYDNPGSARDVVSMDLTFTPDFDALSELERDTMPHGKFVNLLRLDLAGCIPPETVALFRRLKFKRQDDGESHRGQSDEKISRTVQRQVLLGDSAASIPEEAAFDLKVYEEIDLDGSEPLVQCGIIANIEEASFALIPLPGMLHRAKSHVDGVVRDYLADKITNATVVCGSP